MDHNKEQLRKAAVDFIYKREKVPELSFAKQNLAAAVAYVLAKKEGRLDVLNMMQSFELTPADQSLFQEIFWDLVIDRVIVPGAASISNGTVYQVRSDKPSDYQ